MFDIGFLEICLIGVVALLVIGPERLPAVARTLGVYIGRIKRFANSVQTDINREINKSEELKRLLEEQSKIKEVHELIEHTVDDASKTVSLNSPLSTHSQKSMEVEENNETHTHNPPKVGSQQTQPANHATSVEAVNDKPQ